MAYEKIEIYKNHDLGKRKKQFKEKYPKDYKDIIRFLRLLSLGQLSKKEVGEKRQRKILDALLMFKANVKKDFDKLSKRDMEKFKSDCVKGVIKSRYGKKYSDDSLEDYSEIVAKYLEFRIPKKVESWKTQYKIFREWFIIKAKKKTPEVLSEKEVQKLFDNCKTNKERFLIAVLFDGGLRIGEFLNLRFEDFDEPTESFPYYKIDIKFEYSKTSGRKIGMFWRNSNKAISEYLSEIKGEPKEQVFIMDYDNLRRFLRRLGERVLKKRITAHMFRKSSCTYYSSSNSGASLSRADLCRRYGWVISSDVVDVYASRNGDEEKIKEQFVNTSLSKVDKENQELKVKVGIMQKKMNDLFENFTESGLGTTELSETEMKKEKEMIIGAIKKKK